MNIVKELIMFLFSFTVVYVFYSIFVVRKSKEFNMDKIRPEIAFMINRFRLDFGILEYKKVVKTVVFVNSLLIAVALTVSGLIDGFLYQMLGAAVVLLPLIYFSYNLIGKHYKKKMDELKPKKKSKVKK